MHYPEHAQNETNDYIWSLKFKISVQERELEAYRNGNKFKKLKQDYESLCRKKDARIRELEKELAKLRAGMVSMREAWWEEFDDVYKECSKEISDINRQLLKERKTAVKALQEISDLKERLKEWKKKYYDIGSELEEEKGRKQEIYEKLICSPVLNVDFANANVNGKARRVLIVASPGADVAMYYGRNHKGHKGIAGTPVENYVGTFAHDHDTTFYSYGTAHQECMQHNCRYVTGSEENEPDYAWNKKCTACSREC